MTPEKQIASFGGDYDNYTYPRYSLDFSIFRVYENGKPYKSENYLKWSKNGAGDGELTFMIGTPGTTKRQQTLAQNIYERDYSHPVRLKAYNALNKALEEYMSWGTEQKRRAATIYRQIQNYMKRFGGFVKELSDKSVIAKREKREKEFIARIKKDPKLKFAKKSWKLIKKVLEKRKKIYKRERFTTHMYNSRSSVSKLAQIADMIVKYVEEVEKPDKERDAAYRKANIDTLHRKLFSPAPIYPDMEEHMFTSFLQMVKDELGDDDSYVKAALGGESPKAVARKLVKGTRLADIEFRKKLAFGGKKAVEKSKDPFIVWARKVAPIGKEIKDWVKNNVESVITVENNKIAKARFAIYGTSIFPDATSSLRLHYGIVKGYELGTTLVPYKTSFYGLYARAYEFDYKEPFNLPPSFIKNKNRVKMDTPYNFVSTQSCVGGNSGSPIINKNLEFVGIAFDANIQGLIFPYAYDDKMARNVSVHSAGILEALKNIYGAKRVVKELLEK
jgi:hypothetical protein